MKFDVNSILMFLGDSGYTLASFAFVNGKWHLDGVGFFDSDCCDDDEDEDEDEVEEV